MYETSEKRTDNEGYNEDKHANKRPNSSSSQGSHTSHISKNKRKKERNNRLTDLDPIKVEKTEYNEMIAKKSKYHVYRASKKIE